ncbi:MAG: efflux RND transporter periplasmic adaptor subunit, partial [Verrucomicrobiota bacterium]
MKTSLNGHHRKTRETKDTAGYPIPKGLHQSAQGCRSRPAGEATLGHGTKKISNPERVAAKHADDATPSGLTDVSIRLPRGKQNNNHDQTLRVGARSSQPWAGRRNPVGIRTGRSLVTIGLLAGSLVVTLLASGCSKPAVNDPRLQPPRVQVFEAQTAGANSRTFTGIVEARVQSDLGFRVGGKILERSVNMGQRVQKGQILMRLDPVDLKLSFAAQQANVEAARAKYTQTKADEARFAALVKSGAVSRLEYDQARAALDSAKALLEAAEAQATVSNNFSEYAVLEADADGVIVRTLSEPGQVVAAGQTVIQLAHDGPREALINLPEGVRPDLGTTASARLYGQDQAYRARLRELSDAADAASRTFAARYVLEGEAASAPLGSTVTIELITQQSSGNSSVRVPVGAVHDRGNGPGVWIVDGKSEVKFRSVTITSIGQEHVVVSSGVGAGEKVVALGAHLLHEG